MKKKVLVVSKVYLPKNIYADLKALAYLEDTNIRDFIRLAVIEKITKDKVYILKKALKKELL